MEWLNYHHLLYFWAVARYGSVVRASAELKLAQPTISGQVRRLEDVLAVKLFDRVGRRLVLTETGRTVFRYADEIFSIGQELLGTLKGRPSTRPLRLTVGVADVLPKVLVQRLLEPAFHIDKPIQLICREDRVVEDFLGQLAGQEVDMVLADRPLGPGHQRARLQPSPWRVRDDLHGERAAGEAAPRRISARRSTAPPACCPGAHATVRRALDQWFEATQVRPAVVAEFDDSALMSAFGEEGKGIFPAPTVFEDEFRRRYNVQVVGRVKSVRQQFYAISVDRRVQHPAVAAIVRAARQEIFK